MGYPIQLGNTKRPLRFVMVDSTDHLTSKLGLSPTVEILKPDASVWITPHGVISEPGRGEYQVAADALDADALGILSLYAIAPGADEVNERYEIIFNDPDFVVVPILVIASPAETTFVGLVRSALEDYGNYRTHIIPIGVVNGSNTRFQASLRPLGADTHLFDGLTGVEILTGYTLNADNGLLVYDTAPTIGTQHFLEGNVYSFPTTRIHEHLARAGRVLYGMWGESKYIPTVSGSVTTFAPEPNGIDLEILVVTTSLMVARASSHAAARQAIRITDAAGTQDYTFRAPNLLAVVQNLQEELERLITDAGYNMPVFPTTDYRTDYLGQVWTERNMSPLT